MPTVLITGGTGTIGSQLTHLLLQKGYNVTILTRKVKTHQTPHVHFAEWDVTKGTIDIKAVQAADYIIHLAGAGIADKRWTGSRKREIVESRVKSSALLVKALQENQHNIKAVISASAIGYYGVDTTASKQNGFREDDPPSNDFLGSTCQQWEASIQPVEKLGVRLVKLRTGIALSTRGGALLAFLKPLNLGLATILGSGDQMMSWIHIDDLCRMYLYALENESLKGVYNASAAEVVTDKKFVLALAKETRANAYIPVHVPGFVLKLVLGEMSQEVLKSTTINNAAIKATGFQFLYPSLEAALQNLK
ncbi:TIGR01777 family oxidoreductase [Danxiaibacter flavus]|uniref:TIGR01777 family oxidoreductase n=1 Tax=Danxiaibacter flavus TaxID=3049108 RepID=A0ABV3ZD34_9BACT|nr:TIGR01777 family oxidoreductase [Chitinophagaceae bacterium DXS]